MAIPNSGTSTYGFSDQFPAGLRVLVVDDDSHCLKILEGMFRKCLFKVTTCNRVEITLTFLRDNKNNFDIVLSDVHMPDTDGFKLLEQIELEMDLPVIMMSVDDSKNIVMKGVTHDASDFLIKPAQMDTVKNIWQHVICKKKSELKDKDFEQYGRVEDEEQNIDNTSSANEVLLKKSRRRDEEEDEDEVEEDIDTCAPKKQRIVWSLELHQKFVDVVNQLTDDKVVPTKILELMNVPGLRRANVASHLQKYRQYMTRLTTDLQQQQNHNEINNSPYIGSSNTNFGTMSSFHGMDFQAQPTSLLIPGHSFAALQPLHRPSNISPISIRDQRNMCKLEYLTLGFSEGDQMNLLHGIPTTMDPKQLASMNQSNITGNPLLNGVGLARGVSSTVYNPSVVDFSPLYGNSFPNTMNIRGPSSLSLREGLQDVVNVGSKRFVPSYYESQRYGSHHYVQTSGHGGAGDGFNPNFRMPSDLNTQFTVECLQDASCPSNFCPQHLGEDDIIYNTLLEQINAFESEFGFDTFSPSNNLLA